MIAPPRTGGIDIASTRLRDRACIVGVGESGYAKRGSFAAVGELGLAVKAIRAACDDAGLDVADIDGFLSFHDEKAGPTELAPALGISTWCYASRPWGGGGAGLPTAVLNAAMAIDAGVAKHIVIVRTIVQDRVRMGAAMGAQAACADGVAAPESYFVPFGLTPPMAIYALRARRHMARYGTTGDQLAAVAVTQRVYASRNPLAVFRTPLTVEDHHTARLVADPLRLFDCCMESDGASAVIVSSAERSKDLRQAPIYVRAVGTATSHRWNSPITFTEPDDLLATSGHTAAAKELWDNAGIGPKEVDVAYFYDAATIAVILGLEDWGFCQRGDGGAFVADGETSASGSVPVNTHGGNLSEAYQQGLNHLIEGVRQLRGTSHNQIGGAETALFGSALGYAPGGGILIRR